MNYAEAISKIAKKAEELKTEINALYANKFTDEAGPQGHISNVIVAEAAAQRAAQREARLAKAQVMAANFSGDVMKHAQEIFDAGWRDGDDFRLQKAFSITPAQAQLLAEKLSILEYKSRRPIDAYHRMDVYGEYSVMGFTPENVMKRLPEVFEAGWRAEEGADELREAFGITPEQAQEMIAELTKMEERQRLDQIADQVYEASVLLRGFADEEPEEDLPEGYVFPLDIE